MSSDSTPRQHAGGATATEVEEVPIVKARDVLGELVDRALFDGVPTVITRRGRAAAVVISMKDYEKLTAA